MTRLRFFAGGGQPPQSHEVLLVEPDGTGVYLTGMAWPEQPPFDEIGVYRVAPGADGHARLADLARAVVAEPAADAGHADAGGESVRVDGEEASWSPRERGPAAEAFVAAARAAIASARARPLAVARAEVGEAGLALRNRGERPLPVAQGEVRAGRGPADHAPSPLRLARAGPAAAEMPAALAPGAAVALPLPEPAPVTDDDFPAAYVLVHLRWRPEVPGEGDELDGWMIAGPV